MTLELNQVASQVKAMGHSLAGQTAARDEAVQAARALLAQFSTEYGLLLERIARAEKVQEKQRFNWVGAAPTHEALDRAYPLPACPERVTVIASDGSQILPDRHAITLYYLINVGCIVYRHGSNLKPEVFKPKPLLCYHPDDVVDEQGNIVSPGEIRLMRDLSELKALTDLVPAYSQSGSEPVAALLDGQLTLRVIELPFEQQQKAQDEYIQMIDSLREAGALVGGYIDRPRSTFVLALMRLAGLEPDQITEEVLRQNPFRHLSDLDLFDFIGPGERSAIFLLKAKGLEKYDQAGHAIHFFYLNVSANPAASDLARVEIPAWMVANSRALDTLHAVLVRQARLTGGYPYVLARAHELAVISTEEREAVEMMLAIEMRRHNLKPTLSPKKYNKTLLAGRESFRW